MKYLLTKWHLKSISQKCFRNQKAVNQIENCFLNISDFESLFRKVSKDRKGLVGKKLHLERVPICSCVLVTGLKKEITDDTFELYFDNEKRSGGKDVSHVERRGKDQAFVYFEDPSSKMHFYNFFLFKLGTN